jgi:hypothetical protein
VITLIFIVAFMGLGAQPCEPVPTGTLHCKGRKYSLSRRRTRFDTDYLIHPMSSAKEGCDMRTAWIILKCGSSFAVDSQSTIQYGSGYATEGGLIPPEPLFTVSASANTTPHRDDANNITLTTLMYPRCQQTFSNKAML